MKAFRSPFFSILLAVAVALPMAAYAAGRNKGGAAKQKPYVPIHTTISAVSDTSITTSTNSSDPTKQADKVVTYTITPSTVIEVKGQRATAKDLKGGMRVAVTVGDGPNIAARISASDAPHDPPPKNEKKK